MLEVEGGDEATCMKILRHEAGHAIDNAYQLRRRRVRRGSSAARPPDIPVLHAKPYSKSFVQHLDHWYAQSHPDEDFAETFATWLDPGTDWRVRYIGWPVERKLQYIDRLMRALAQTKPKVTTTRRSRAAVALEKTLREHYRPNASTMASTRQTSTTRTC